MDLETNGQGGIQRNKGDIGGLGDTAGDSEDTEGHNGVEGY